MSGYPSVICQWTPILHWYVTWKLCPGPAEVSLSTDSPVQVHHSQPQHWTRVPVVRGHHDVPFQHQEQSHNTTISYTNSMDRTVNLHPNVTPQFPSQHHAHACLSRGEVILLPKALNSTLQDLEISPTSQKSPNPSHSCIHGTRRRPNKLCLYYKIFYNWILCTQGHRWRFLLGDPFATPSAAGGLLLAAPSEARNQATYAKFLQQVS